MTQPQVKPSTERMRRLNARRKAGIKLPKCQRCDSKCTSPEGIKVQLCSDCRRATPEGRKKAIDNAYKSMHRRARLKAFDDLPALEWDWQEVDKVLPNHLDQVLIETIRGARTIGTYYPTYGWVDTVDGSPVKAKRWAEIPKQEAS